MPNTVKRAFGSWAPVGGLITGANSPSTDVFLSTSDGASSGVTQKREKVLKQPVSQRGSLLGALFFCKKEAGIHNDTRVLVDLTKDQMNI